MKPNKLWLILSVIAATSSACVSIPNTTHCSVLSIMRDGATCAQSQTDKIDDLTLDELIDMLEPQEERHCVPVGAFVEGKDAFGAPVTKFEMRAEVCAQHPLEGAPVMLLPKRSGAIITPSEDYLRQKTAIEQACRLLGKRCSYEIRQTIASMEKAAKR